MNDSGDTESQWQALFNHWKKEYEASLEDYVDKKERASACLLVAAATARSTLEWCKANHQQLHETYNKLKGVEDLIYQLYDALTPLSTKPLKLKPNVMLWRHVDLPRFVDLASGQEIHFPIDDRALKGPFNHLYRQSMDGKSLSRLGIRGRTDVRGTHYML